MALLSAWCCACIGPRPDTFCDIRDADWSVLREAATLRAHVRVVSGGEDDRLEVVVQRQGDALVVVGLTHYGVRLFTVHQQGESIRVGEALAARYETTARVVMDALHRGWTSPGPLQATPGGAELIRYARSDGGPGFEVRVPRCGYEASVVVVTGTLPAWMRDGIEGVEP